MSICLIIRNCSPVTYQTAYPQYKTFIEVFKDKKLSEINVRECEDFRLSLMEDYSQNYAKGLCVN